MFALRRYTAKIVTIGGIYVLAMCVASMAHAQGNVVMGFDALMAINSGDAGGTVMGSNPDFGGFGRFTYDGIMIAPSTELGRYGAFEIRKDGAGGSGMGFDFTSGQADNPVNAGAVISPVANNMFPLLDRAAWGTNFDPTQYVAELVFKPLPTNNGDQLNMTLDTFDGFDSAGARRAEQWQWSFTGLASPNPGTNPLMMGPDADGFYTVRNNGGSLSGPNAGYGGADAPSHMFEIAPLPGAGDDAADFNDFEAFGLDGRLPVPNGARQIHLQTPYDDVSTADHFAIKSLRLVKLSPDSQEVARMDGHTGFSIRFGSPFRRDAGDPPINIAGTNYIPSDFNTFANTDQVTRFDQSGFTNIFLNTDDDLEVGGLAVFQPPATQAFDGTNASVEVRARLTVAQGAGQADRIVLVLKDRDGNDTGAGQGGDEYHYDLLLSNFDTGAITPFTVPLTSFTPFTAGEFVNAGDGLLSNFNLYHLGIETLIGAGLVNMEIESIRVLLPSSPGLDGDFNEDGKVDAADYVAWRKNGANPLPNDAGLTTSAARFDLWRANFGNMQMPGGGADTAVPEPAAGALGLIALGALAAVRRRTQ